MGFNREVKIGEAIMVGEIEVQLRGTRRNKATLYFHGPKHVKIGPCTPSKGITDAKTGRLETVREQEGRASSKCDDNNRTV